MRRILLVEDNDLNRDMLSRRLRRAGFDVAEAADGEQGCLAALELHPDLILMDMSLPVTDGWTAADRIKSRTGTAGIPIIALTAHAMPGDRQRAMESGCDDYDTKPVELPRLLGKITHLLGGGGALNGVVPGESSPEQDWHLLEDGNE